MRTVLTSPRWLAGHLAVLGLCVGFVFLGRWQWNESQAPGGDFQNFAYAIQWWLFIVVAFAWYGKIIRDDAKARRLGPVAATAHAAPPPSPQRAPGQGRQVLVAGAALGGGRSARAAGYPPGEPPAEPDGDEIEDRELMEWNAWLARLNASGRR